MDELTLSTDIALEKLLNGDYVGYSPAGSAKPFLLTGKALSVIEFFLETPVLDLPTLKTFALSKGVSDELLSGLLDKFADEKILTGWKIPPQVTTKKTRSRKQISFWIHLTDDCNLACSYCYVTKGKKMITEDVISEFTQNLVDFCVKYQVQEVYLKFAGGEPLMAYSRMLDFVNNVKNKLNPLRIKVGCGVLTNGTLVTPEIARSLAEEGFNVSVSLDGIGSYNSIRSFTNGINSFDEVVKGIINLQKEDINPKILVVMSNINIEGFTEIMNFSREHGLRISLSVSRDLTPEGKLDLKPGVFKNKFIPELIEEIAGSKELPKMTFNNLDLWGKRFKPCGAGFNYLALGVNGSLSSCQMTIDDPIISSVGINEGIAEALTKYHQRNLPKICSECVWRYACAGGCEVMAQEAGRVDRPSLHCNFNKEILSSLLILEGRRIQNAERKRSAIKAENITSAQESIHNLKGESDDRCTE